MNPEPLPTGYMPTRLTQGTATDEAGSPLTGVTDPDAAAGMVGPGLGTGLGVGANRYGSSIPQYMGYLEMFKRQYGDAPPELQNAAMNVFTTLNHLFSIGPVNNNKGWHPQAYTYDFSEFVRDVAVAAAASHGGATAIGQTVASAVGAVAGAVKKKAPEQQAVPSGQERKVQ